MPDEQQQQQQTVIVKVRAKLPAGRTRLARTWPAADTYARVSEADAKTLEADPMLTVTRVSEGDVPPDQQASIQGDIPANNPDPNVQRDLMADGEYPTLTQGATGAPVYRGAPDENQALQQQLRDAPGVPPPQPAPTPPPIPDPGEAKPEGDTRDAEQVFVSPTTSSADENDALLGGTSDRKRKR